MQLNKMRPGKPQCLLYSAATLLDVAPDILEREIGHDGLKLVDGNKQGHHIQEIMDCFIRRNKYLVWIDPRPTFKFTEGGKEYAVFDDYDFVTERMKKYFQQYSGLVLSEDHAVAWNHKEQLRYDPNGFRRTLDDFEIKEFWLYIG